MLPYMKRLLSTGSWRGPSVSLYSIALLCATFHLATCESGDAFLKKETAYALLHSASHAPSRVRRASDLKDGWRELFILTKRQAGIEKTWTHHVDRREDEKKANPLKNFWRKLHSMETEWNKVNPAINIKSDDNNIMGNDLFRDRLETYQMLDARQKIRHQNFINLLKSDLYNVDHLLNQRLTKATTSVQDQRNFDHHAAETFRPHHKRMSRLRKVKLSALKRVISSMD